MEDLIALGVERGQECDFVLNGAPPLALPMRELVRLAPLGIEIDDSLAIFGVRPEWNIRELLQGGIARQQQFFGLVEPLLRGKAIAQATLAAEGHGAERAKGCRTEGKALAERRFSGRELARFHQ